MHVVGVLFWEAGRIECACTLEAELYAALASCAALMMAFAIDKKYKKTAHAYTHARH